MKSVAEYMEKGFDRRTAEYFASGRKRITAVEALDNFLLRLAFENGEIRILDCKPFIKGGTVFAPLMEDDSFKNVYLDDNECVSWDIDPAVDSNVMWSNKIDISSDTCYLDSVPV